MPIRNVTITIFFSFLIFHIILLLLFKCILLIFTQVQIFARKYITNLLSLYNINISLKNVR